MAGLAVVLGDLLVILRKHDRRVVFGAVDYPGLQGAEGFTGAHGYSAAAQRIHGVEEQGVLHHAHLPALQVGERTNGPFAVEVA
ncbi:hypothetical protein D9M68_514200 [compost metagenome]